MALGIVHFVVFLFFEAPLWFYVPSRSIFLLAGLCFSYTSPIQLLVLLLQLSRPSLLEKISILIFLEQWCKVAAT